jgi:ABC-type glycerol-3-phosphate transport system substrate-binding protein
MICLQEILLQEIQKEIVDKYKIDPETLDYSEKGDKIKTIGYSPKTKLWYGWSHRTVNGFKTKKQAAKFAKSVS